MTTALLGQPTRARVPKGKGANSARSVNADVRRSGPRTGSPARYLTSRSNVFYTLVRPL